MLAALLATVAGCSSSHREIDAIGVVASSDFEIVGSNTVYTYTFDDGRTYSQTYEGHVLAGGGPSVGDLLIAGSKPSNWVLVATPQHPGPEAPAGCYATRELNGEVHETSVDLLDGLTLPKAPNYAFGSDYPAGAHLVSAVLCLDRQGRVTWISGGRG
jgi:hypothetical protein